MRPTVWLSLVALGLLAVVPTVQARGANARAANRALPTVAGWTVEGSWAVSPEEAVQDALEKAQLRVGDYLAQQTPPIEWRPGAEYVRDHLLQNIGKDEGFTTPAADGQVEEVVVAGRKVRRETREFKDLDGNVRQSWRACLHVEIGPREREEIRQMERAYQNKLRQGRAEQRQGAAVRLVAGLVALLAAIAAYLRLEDATKGYYTTLLRLAAVSFVALVGAGIWLFS